MHPSPVQPFRRLQKLIAASLSLACLSSPLAFAKSNHEGWYQVEMIVFARQTPSTQETWPKDIKLRYPGNWVELKDPNAPLAPPITATTETQSLNGDASAPIQATQPTPAAQPDFTREPYWQLPSSQYSLNDQARRLQQNPKYQVLFHQAWRQLIGSRKNAKNLLVYGGQSFGQHYQLEGSINLSVATYLKIVTNLWLTDFSPVATASTITSTMGDSAAATTSQSEAQSEVQSAWPELPARPNLKQVSSLASEMLSANLEGEPFSTATEQSEAMPITLEEDVPAFIPSRIVLMKQERDMRSREVHYLDHPLLGVIIKIVPYYPGSDSAAATNSATDAASGSATDAAQDLLPSDNPTP